MNLGGEREFTGGGTAEHVTPNLALIEELKKEYELFYIGMKNGMEEDLISKKEIKFYGIRGYSKVVQEEQTLNLAAIINEVFQNKAFYVANMEKANLITVNNEVIKIIKKYL